MLGKIGRILTNVFKATGGGGPMVKKHVGLFFKDLNEQSEMQKIASKLLKNGLQLNY